MTLIAWVVVSLFLPGQVTSEPMDVAALWCNQNCWEGHDREQCLCEKWAGAPDTDPKSWIRCFTERCCTSTGSPRIIFINPGTCVRSNETGFFSLATWGSIFGGNTCNLSKQSPW